MSDERVVSALRAEVGNDWSVLDTLAAMDEPERRKALRSHRELGFTTEEDASVVRLRQKLDVALDRLMLLELGIEAGLLSDADIPVGEGLRTLLHSGAFVRYLNSYLYFGVRFIATRIWGEAAHNAAVHEDEDINELPVGLPTPPVIGPDQMAHADDAVKRWHLSLPESEKADDVRSALDFLDDIVTIPGEQSEYALWLEGLSTYPADDPHFQSLTRGLVEFAAAKTAFYQDPEGQAHLTEWERVGFAPDTWTAKHPLIARFGVIDLYWLARLLRADVSSTGFVTYKRGSWLNMLAAKEPGTDLARRMARADEVLRAVFDYTCDLVQNAVQIGADAFERRVHPEAFPEWPATTVNWRAAYDEELEEITRQRRVRQFDETTKFDEGVVDDVLPGGRMGWSRRVRTGEHVENLIGLAFSGGGIRSATFNLGVLQRLQEIDVLREVDYLSTVSGGGYIGSWLLANVRRTGYWLSQLTDWGPSIDHLRRFSNYLAPQSGLMSADSWTMWASWIRNAVLIQFTAAIWVAILLVSMYLLKGLFASAAFTVLAYHPANLVLGIALGMLAWSISTNLRREARSSREIHVLMMAVVPAWVGSFATAAMLWAIRDDIIGKRFSEILVSTWYTWLGPLILLGACFWYVSWLSISAKRMQGSDVLRLLLAFFAAAVAEGVVYLGLCGIYFLFASWSVSHPDSAIWYVYASGAFLVLFVMTAAVVMIIGLIGHDSPDWRREWWTRFGAWLGIYGAAFLALSLTAIFAPYFTLWLYHLDWTKLKWGTAIGWIATVVGGLLTGNSERTDGKPGESAVNKALGAFTKLAAFLFVVGAVLIVSTALHALFVKTWTEASLSADYWKTLNSIRIRDYGWSLLVLLVVGLAFSWRFEINIFGLNQFYRNRLVRCYLGATRWRPGLRKPHRFTGFDPLDDIPLSQFLYAAEPKAPFRGPFPLVNCSLNLGGSSDLGLHSRHSASFVLTPLRSGADRRQVGYAQSRGGTQTYAGGVPLGQAISVSGAAASPNMGFHTSPLVAVLLTMFNVRLAWWFPNPGKRFWSATWLRFSLWYLVREMFARADENNFFVNVSDGGHFENLGIYELVRRRCKVIIASDGECDQGLEFGSLGNVVRMCETDFGARIDIDVESIRKQKESGVSRAHCAVGRITYGNGSRGYLIYLKASLSGDEDIGIEQYVAAHPEFPHEPTSDQFFAEDQFESYRRLGHHIAKMTFRGVEGESNLVTMARRLSDLWIPASVGSDSFVNQTEALSALWQRFGTTPSLFPLFRQLTMNGPSPSPGEPTEEELAVCLELIQQMENVFLALRLDDFWHHPDNRGWTILFRAWAKSPTFRVVWQRLRPLFGMRFQHFCNRRLGL